MRVQYDHRLLSSFKEWYQHVLLNEAKAYRNITSGQLYFNNNDQWDGHDVFTSPNHQWVYDESVVGAQVPSGVYINNVFAARGSDGLKIDFNRGQAILDKSSAKGSNIVASYSKKEFNIYLTSLPTDRLIAETKFETRPRLKVPNTGLNPNSVVSPAIFIKQELSRNDPFCFGGADMTTNRIRAICFADNEYQAVGVKSLFRDKARTNFCLLNNTPINEYGDIKSGNVWNYNDNLADNSLVFIEDVVVSDLENDVIANHHPSLYVSVMEFELKKQRYPRQ